MIVLNSTDSIIIIIASYSYSPLKFAKFYGHVVELLFVIVVVVIQLLVECK